MTRPIDFPFDLDNWRNVGTIHPDYHKEGYPNIYEGTHVLHSVCTPTGLKPDEAEKRASFEYNVIRLVCDYHDHVEPVVSIHKLNHSLL